MITQDIQDVIKRNLPAEVGDALKAQLNSLSELEAKSKKDNDTIQNLRLDASTMKREMDRITDLLLQHKALDEREGEVRKRELEAGLVAMKHELAAEQRISKAFEATLAGLVRNVEWRNSASGMMPVAVPGMAADANNYNRREPIVATGHTAEESTSRAV